VTLIYSPYHMSGEVAEIAVFARGLSQVLLGVVCSVLICFFFFVFVTHATVRACGCRVLHAIPLGAAVGGVGLSMTCDPLCVACHMSLEEGGGRWCFGR